MVEPLPAGPLLSGRNGRRYLAYSAVSRRFATEIRAAGIAEGFSPHSLRHAFASTLLAQGVPITDVAHWLGHKSIAIKFEIYGHLVPSAAGRGRVALDREFAEWSAAA
jgi:integrase